MNRFLQHVIATAQNPGGSIHPVLGSVYSPTAPSSVAAGMVPGEQRPETAPPADSGDGRTGGRRSGGRQTGLDADDRARPQGAAESHPAFDSSLATGDPEDPAAQTRRARTRVPLVTPSISGARDPWNTARTGETSEPRNDAASRAAAAAVPASAMRNASSGRGDHAAQTANPAADRDPTTAGGDAFIADRHPSTAGHYSPLMPDDLAGPATAGAIAPVVSSLRSRKSDAAEARDNSHRSRPAARDADEITIHIGRIEVTAAPPALSVAPTPPRKSPSLDEFLKRRPGRAG